MNIEIVGVSSSNKGAELMLRAILDRFANGSLTPRLVIDPGRGDFAWRSSHGLYQRFSPDEVGRLGRIIRPLLRAPYRDLYGLVDPREIDVVLGAEGYAYGDPWNPAWIEAAATRYERASSLGQRIILLPQAFGPFQNERVRTATTRILDCADLVFVRDPTSLDHVRSLGAHENVRLAPDFTNLVAGAVPDDWDLNPRGVAIVPNRQMTQHGVQGGDHYEGLLTAAIEQVRKADLNPFLLVHETHDHELARRLASSCQRRLDVVSNDDPVALKAILGSCVFTLGSRFHGLVSALSQGVPSIATTWSHKYAHLMADYGVPELLSDEDQPMGPLIERLADSGERDALATRIAERSSSLQTLSQEMWREVDALLSV